MPVPSMQLLAAKKAAAGVSKTLTFLQGAEDITNTTVFTFASQNLGTADAGRYIIACVFARNGAAVSVSSVTIGGVTATEVAKVQSATPDSATGIFVANVPTGTTGDVVLTTSGSLRAAISLYSATGITTTAFDSDISQAANPTATLNVTAGGFIVAAAASASTSGTSDSMSWTNATENYDAESELRFLCSSASDPTPTTTTLAITAVSTDPTLTTGVFASW